MRLRQKALIGCAALAVMTAGPAFAQKKRTDISPYIEVGQVLTADLKDGDVLTYTTISAGVDASIQTQRTQVQLSYRYERRIDYEKDVGDSDIHSGLARAEVQVIPGLLNIEGGAIATRARNDIRGGAPIFGVGNVANVSQVYSAYAGPTLGKRFGALDVSAAYRLGYTKVEQSTGFDLPANQPRLDSYDDSWSHLATASVGMAPGASGLPFGWGVTGSWQREDAGQLDQRYQSKFIRGDVTVPVSATLALVGGVGYEDIEISQRDALRDAAGVPLADDRGRYITDPNSPRLIAYDTDGLIWDAGIVWKPSRRTQLEARVGRRYGSMTYTGSFSHQFSPASGVQVTVYDGVQSFGRLLNDNLSRLPTSFTTPAGGLTDGLGGCVFGSTGGTGGCLNDAFQSISTANFRARGVNALYSVRRGPLSLGAGLSYAQRRYFAPRIAGTFSVDGVRDESYSAQGYVGYQIDSVSNVDGNVYVNYYNSGIAGAPNVLGTGATGSYYRTFLPRLTGTISAGIYSSDVETLESSVIAAGLVGLRYDF